jgi:hypothetical protein
MEKDIENELPQSVKDEMEAAKKEGGEQEAPEEEAQPERVQLSRRAQKEEDRKAEISAANERAEKAERLAETIRQESNERLARMEGMIGGLAQQRQEPQYQARPAVTEDANEQARRLRKEAKAALVAGEFDDYEEKTTRANAIERDDAIQRAVRSLPQPQQQQRLPDWVTAVEAQFPDVVMHPAGKNAVAAFGQIEMAKTGRAIDPQGLMSAFTRAREELGIAKRNDTQNTQRRQQMASGPSNGATHSRGAREQSVMMPKGWESVARKAGVPLKEYAKQYAASNPKDVVDD